MKTRIVYSAAKRGLHQDGYPYVVQFKDFLRWSWTDWRTFGTLEEAKAWLDMMMTKDQVVWP